MLCRDRRPTLSGCDRGWHVPRLVISFLLSTMASSSTTTSTLGKRTPTPATIPGFKRLKNTAVSDSLNDWQYKWQGRHLFSFFKNKKKLSTEECQAWVDKIAKEFCPGMIPPRVSIDENMTNYGLYNPRYNTIKIRPFSRKLSLVLHECAHMVVHHRHRGKEDGEHGKCYIRILLELVKKYAEPLGLDYDKMRSEAVEKGIVVPPPVAIPVIVIDE